MIDAPGGSKFGAVGDRPPNPDREGYTIERPGRRQEGGRAAPLSLLAEKKSSQAAMLQRRPSKLGFFPITKLANGIVRRSDGTTYGEDDRWLSSSFYEAATDAFMEYDPNSWLQTIRITLTPFIFAPFVGIVGFTFILTIVAQLVDADHKEWISMPMDAHVVMGKWPHSMPDRAHT